MSQPEDAFFRLERRAPTVFKQYLYESKGKQLEDIWINIHIDNPMDQSRTAFEYPTSNPKHRDTLEIDDAVKLMQQHFLPRQRLDLRFPHSNHSDSFLDPAERFQRITGFSSSRVRVGYYNGGHIVFPKADRRLMPPC
jgi:hypothetical protein